MEVTFPSKKKIIHITKFMVKFYVDLILLDVQTNRNTWSTQVKLSIYVVVLDVVQMFELNPCYQRTNHGGKKNQWLRVSMLDLMHVD